MLVEAGEALGPAVAGVDVEEDARDADHLTMAHRSYPTRPGSPVLSVRARLLHPVARCGPSGPERS